MSQPLSDFFDLVNSTYVNNIVYVEYNKNEYDLIDQLCFVPVDKPSNKQLRIALDLIDEIYPLFKGLSVENKCDALREVFKINTTPERLKSMTSIKKILFKRVITVKNNKVIFKRVLKH